MSNNNNLYTIKEAINKLLKAYRLDSKLEEVNLLNSWERIMGPMIARHTTNVYIRNRELFVKIDSAALRHELSMGKEKIADILNKEAGKKLIDKVVLL